MALFFAYGCELNHPHILAKILVNSIVEAAMVDGPQPGVELAREALVAAPDTSTSQSDAAAVIEQLKTKNQTATRVKDYALKRPVATGYIPNSIFIYRRRQDENADSLTDIDSALGMKLWGILFDLPETTIEALCKQYDADRTCVIKDVVIQNIEATQRPTQSSRLSIGDVVKARVLSAKDVTLAQASATKSMIAVLLPIYQKYRAPLYAFRALLGCSFTQLNAIVKGGRDSADRVVEEVYYKSTPKFAIYRTADRVSVQYADDVAEAERQRTAMAAISPLRSQITGLVDGWSRSNDKRAKERADRYNARVAAAINQLLERDADGAKLTLEGIKADILAKRTSWGRFQYLIGACTTTVALCVIFWLIKQFAFGTPNPTDALWLSARAGAVGAFFSIAMNVRDRRVQLDLNGRDNYADACLRVFVGAIGAGVLTCLLHSGLIPNTTMGTAPLTGGGMTWEVLLVLGFAAGFSERLVPAMFDKLGSDIAGDEKPSSTDITPRAAGTSIS